MQLTSSRRTTAGLDTNGVTKPCKGTNGGKVQDSEPQTSRPLPRDRRRDRPASRGQRHSTDLHSGQAQPTAQACDPRRCDPCYSATATAPRWANDRPAACAHVPTRACDTILSGMETCKLSRFSDLSLIQCKSDCATSYTSNHFPRQNYPTTSTRCFTTTRHSNDPARSRPRRQRRHKNHHGHKNEQTSRF